MGKCMNVQGYKCSCHFPGDIDPLSYIALAILLQEMTLVVKVNLTLTFSVSWSVVYSRQDAHACGTFLQLSVPNLNVWA